MISSIIQVIIMKGYRLALHAAGFSFFIFLYMFSMVLLFRRGGGGGGGGGRGAVGVAVATGDVEAIAGRGETGIVTRRLTWSPLDPLEGH